jgi:hypothetical protein
MAMFPLSRIEVSAGTGKRWSLTLTDRVDMHRMETGAETFDFQSNPHAVIDINKRCPPDGLAILVLEFGCRPLS